MTSVQQSAGKKSDAIPQSAGEATGSRHHPTADRAILWAVDPREVELKPDFSALEALSRCGDGLCVPVQPVTVREATPTARELQQSQTYLESLSRPGFRPARWLVAESGAREGAVKRLLEEAEQRGAPLIAVSSHGRRGPSRWMLGSFAENLLELSPIPVLFLTHQTSRSSVPEPTVLFATDFSPHAKEAFTVLLDLAAAGGLKVILYYSATLPLQASSDVGLVGLPAALTSEFMDEQKKWARRQAVPWERQAQGKGVSLGVEVQTGGLNIANTILQAAAKHRVLLVAMAASSSTFSRAVLGSITREVSRENAFPVWIHGPAVRRAH
jgi:nucleotide-binding universal stress UspA family protein